MNKIKSLLWFIAKFAIAFIVIVWLISDNSKNVLKAFGQIDISWLLIAIGAYAFSMFFAAYRWYLLLRVQGIMISLWETLSLSMQGAFFSLVMPGGVMGGDVVKTTFLVSRTQKGSKLSATSTVFMDRFIGMLSQFIIAIVFAIPFMTKIKHMGNAAKLTVIFVLVLSLLGILAAVCLFKHRIFEKIPGFSHILHSMDKPMGGLITHAMEILDVYNSKRKIMMQCVLISIFPAQLVMASTLYFIARGIHCANTSILPLVLALALGNTAALLPITPAGLGVRDVIVKIILVAGLFTVGNAIAITLLFSSIMITVNLSTGFFSLLCPRGKGKYPKIKE